MSVLCDLSGFTSELGALFTFPSNTTSVLVRTGVSFISSDQACSNAESEIPDFDFEATQAAARQAWNEVLGNVNVELFDVTVAGSGNETVNAVDAGSDQEDLKVLLYSSVSASIFDLVSILHFCCVLIAVLADLFFVSHSCIVRTSALPTVSSSLPTPPDKCLPNLTISIYAIRYIQTPVKILAGTLPSRTMIHSTATYALILFSRRCRR